MQQNSEEKIRNSCTESRSPDDWCHSKSMTRIPHKPSAVLTQTLRSSGLLSPTKRLRPVSFLRKRAWLFLPFSHNDCVSYIVLPGPHRNHLHPFSPFLQSQWTKRPLFYQKPTPHVCPLCLQGVTLSSPRPSSSARKHSFRTQFYLNIAHLDKPPSSLFQLLLPLENVRLLLSATQ